jgi:hypothetical protein
MQYTVVVVGKCPRCRVETSHQAISVAEVVILAETVKGHRCVDRTKTTFVMIVTEEHVGRGWVKVGDRLVNFPMGPAQDIDVGKRIYNVDGVFQVENNEQRDRRILIRRAAYFCGISRDRTTDEIIELRTSEE